MFQDATFRGYNFLKTPCTAIPFILYCKTSNGKPICTAVNCIFENLSTPVKHIAHFDLDAFFVSVEVLKNPALKGKALIVGGDGQRGIVAACSYEARKYGIQSAMPSLTAKRLCPHAIFIRGSYADYSHYSRMVTSIIADKVRLFEKASIDEFYVDLTGMEKFFGVSQYTRELRNTIVRENGLPISYRLSTSKIVSKM